MGLIAGLDVDAARCIPVLAAAARGDLIVEGGRGVPWTYARETDTRVEP
jgi:hypothetical protein